MLCPVFVMSGVCYVQHLLCLVFVMYIFCYVHCLLYLVFVMSVGCYVPCLSCPLSVMSAICYVRCLLCPVFVMSIVCLSRVCRVQCLSVQDLTYYHFWKKKHVSPTKSNMIRHDFSLHYIHKMVSNICEINRKTT